MPAGCGALLISREKPENRYCFASSGLRNRGKARIHVGDKRASASSSHKFR